MIAKKTPKADLEKKRFAFFQIGLLIAGSSCLAAFEYSSVKPTDQQVYVEPAPDIFGEPIPDKTIEILRPQKQNKKVQRGEEIEVVKKIVEEKFVETIKIDTSDIIITEPIGDPDPGAGIGYEKPGDIIPVPDVEPSFPGGIAAMSHYINDNIELPYDIPAYDQGTVYVEFVVNKNGSIEQVKIRRGLSVQLNKAAKKVVKNMPKWIPGEQAGKPVRVRFTLPIKISSN